MIDEKPWQGMSDRAWKGLCCPRCKQTLALEDDHLVCRREGCDLSFPITAGIPVLIDESHSLFSIEHYDSASALRARQGWPQKSWQRLLPGISKNLNSEANYRQFARLLTQQVEAPLVLVVGGGITGSGMRALAEFSGLELVSSDVVFGPRTQLISDAHDIPFPDGFFDGVIIQAVLEHVLDPQRCAAEIHRALKPAGLVYAETPFMQQVHEGRYDFTRFTHLGHRRLFRWFEELASGPTGGPGMALAWSWRYFLLSFAAGRNTRALLGGLARLSAFCWKYFDPLLKSKAGIYDAAAGYYFLGRRSETPLDDRALVKQYRGAIGLER